MTDPYAVLGLPRHASAEQVKAAYRALAKKHHPDRQGGSKERFQEITAAYDAIKNGVVAPIRRRPNPTVPVNCSISLEEAYHGCEVLITVAMGGTTTDILAKVPAGIDDGQFIVVKGSGPILYPESPPGDVHAVIRIRKHPRFMRVGANLAVRIDIDALDAMLGCEREIEGIDEMVNVVIPPACQHGQEVRIAQKGMPRAGGGRGDLLIVVAVEIPRLDARQTELVRQIKSLQSGADDISFR